MVMTRHQSVENASIALVDRHIAANRGDHVALRYKDKRYTYNDLAALANRSGNLLRRAGVERGGGVLLLVAPSPALVGSLLGAIKIAAVPLVPEGDWTPAALKACAEKARPLAIIADQAGVAGLDAAVGPQLPKTFVVGSHAGRHESFVALLREMPSSLTAEAVAEAAPALMICGGTGLTTVTHAELAAATAGGTEVNRALASWRLLPLLKAFARGEEASV